MKQAKPSHVIESDLNSRGIFLLRVAALSLVIVLASVWWLSRMIELERHDSIVQILPPAAGIIGLFCLLRGLYQAVRFRKFGQSVLEADVPVAGQPWKGAIRTASDIRVRGDYTVTLTCEKKTYDVNLKKTRVATLWKDICVVKRDGVRSAAGIPFSFPTPDRDLKEAFELGSGSGSIRWWLEIKAPATGFDYFAIFDVGGLMFKQDGVKEGSWWLPVGNL